MNAMQYSQWLQKTFHTKAPTSPAYHAQCDALRNVHSAIADAKREGKDAAYVAECEYTTYFDSWCSITYTQWLHERALQGVRT